MIIIAIRIITTPGVRKGMESSEAGSDGRTAHSSRHDHADRQQQAGRQQEGQRAGHAIGRQAAQRERGGHGRLHGRVDVDLAIAPSVVGNGGARDAAAVLRGGALGRGGVEDGFSRINVAYQERPRGWRSLR